LWFASLMDSREATSPLLPVPSRLARWRPGLGFPQLDYGPTRPLAGTARSFLHGSLRAD